jgi:ferredoxin-NADP reductase
MITNTKFKQALNKLEIGDEIERSHIDGDFIWEENVTEEIIFVAAGIGITPFRSILIERKNAGKKLNAQLLYFNRNSEIIFQDELKELSKNHPEFQVEFIIGERVSAESILSRIIDKNNKVIYLTGPEPMVESVGEDLKQKGIKVKQDWFPGYDEKNF